MGHAEVGVSTGCGHAAVRIVIDPPARRYGAVLAARSGQADEVPQDLDERIAVRGGPKQEPADSGQPVEEVVLAEACSAAVRHPFGGCDHALVSDPLDVPDEGIGFGGEAATAISARGVQDEGQCGCAVVQAGVWSCVDTSCGGLRQLAADAGPVAGATQRSFDGKKCLPDGAGGQILRASLGRVERDGWRGGHARSMAARRWRAAARASRLVVFS